MDYGESTQQETTTRSMIRRERKATIQAIKEASRGTLTRNKVRSWRKNFTKLTKSLGLLIIVLFVIVPLCI